MNFRILFLAAIVAVTMVLVNQASTKHVSAMADTFPTTEAQFVSQFGVVFDPADSSAIVVREGRNGFEIHCEGCDAHEIGSHELPICIDYDPATSMLVAGYYSVFADYGPQWERIQLAPGQWVQWWGFQVSVYAGTCQPAPGQGPASPAQTVPVAAVAQPVQQPAATGCPGAPVSVDVIARHTGTNASSWKPLDGTMQASVGWKFDVGPYTGPSSLVQIGTDTSDIEVLTPNAPAQPGIPVGTREGVVVATAYDCRIPR